MEPRNTEKRPRFVTFFLSPSRLLAEEISLGFRRQFFYDTLREAFRDPAILIDLEASRITMIAITRVYTVTMESGALLE